MTRLERARVIFPTRQMGFSCAPTKDLDRLAHAQTQCTRTELTQRSMIINMSQSMRKGG